MANCLLPQVLLPCRKTVMRWFSGDIEIPLHKCYFHTAAYFRGETEIVMVFFLCPSFTDQRSSVFMHVWTAISEVIGGENRKSSGIWLIIDEILSFHVDSVWFFDDFPKLFSDESGIWRTFFYI